MLIRNITPALIAIGLVALPVATAAKAADSDYSATYNTCMDRSGGVTVEMRDCSAAETARWDGILNAAYKAKMASLSPDQKIQLRDDERAWIKRRVKECDSVDAEETGTMRLIETDGCFLDQTISRARYLQAGR